MSDESYQLTADEADAAKACGLTAAEYKAWAMAGTPAATRRLVGLESPSRVPRTTPLTREEMAKMSDSELAELTPSDLTGLDRETDATRG